MVPTNNQNSKVFAMCFVSDGGQGNKQEMGGFWRGLIVKEWCLGRGMVLVVGTIGGEMNCLINHTHTLVNCQ